MRVTVCRLALQRLLHRFLKVPKAEKNARHCGGHILYIGRAVRCLCIYGNDIIFVNMY